ncbi:MAG: Hsp33 family molecular chaperone HslO [Oscillospiraceae bacterium]|nr:Hsp33 family molecular chaperone HslO [Oscillospiraceae bacterium]
MGRIVRTISKDASVVCSAIDGKDIVSEIERIHKTSAVVTAALGRLSMAASLMGFGLKGEKDSITIRLNGGGPTGSLIAVADSFGNVKSYVQNPVVEIPLNQFGKLDVKGAVGTNGYLGVVKDLGLKEPYSGQVPIVSGEIAEDITNYLATSEQVPSACALGVLVNPDLTVAQAGGFIVELLPFAPEEVVTTIEENIKKMSSVTTLLSEGKSVEDIAMMALDGLEPNVLDDFKVSYRCTCSREKVETALISTGKEELLDMAKDEQTQVECHFCDKKYVFTSAEIMALCEKASQN